MTRIVFLLAFSGLGGRTQAVRKDRYDPTKPFSCPKCQRRYSRKDNLQAHMRYECGQDPQFSCPLCQHKFSHRRYIQKHMLRRHPDEYEEFQKSSPSDSVWCWNNTDILLGAKFNEQLCWRVHTSSRTSFDRCCDGYFVFWIHFAGYHFYYNVKATGVCVMWTNYFFCNRYFSWRS